MQYSQVKEYMLNKLKKELNHELYYHGVHHTIDVIASCKRLSESEGINANDLLLLQTAAVFHDSGFLETYKGHEEVSCRYAGEMLPGYGYRASDIEKICEMIMATQIPQSPKSFLSKILCDSDLDYLGRSDFDPISNGLYKELIAYNMVQDVKQWNRIQVSFLGNHNYFTKTAKDTREIKKQQKLDELKLIVASYDDK
ncbi:MAG: phosphohydrolase [Bacteroidetes bacterium]|nr:phosphohydrolase [Bacteroidota bacterium]